ncbi:hypothetical protein HMPREF1117_0668 [Streptococcus sp. SK643]|nr:hypothetical protein HMPREF1117_0668 [Streptococcus sp. SK643]
MLSLENYHSRQQKMQAPKMDTCLQLGGTFVPLFILLKIKKL